MILVLVDTNIWSAVLRRNSPDQDLTKKLTELIINGKACLIGPIRQEILSGIKSKTTFDKLKKILKSFDQMNISNEDYELAAELNNKCRSKGIQGSHTDYLICAVAINNKMKIFSEDKDFENFQKVIEIELF